MTDNPTQPPSAPRGRGRPKKSEKKEIINPLQIYSGQTKEEQLLDMYNQWHSCKRCYLANFREGDDICFATGNPDASIMIVGEAPGEEEERTSQIFVGESGRLLNQMLASVSDDVGIQELWQWWAKLTRRSKKDSETFHERVTEWRNTEFFLTNTVACRPPDNRTPTGMEQKSCWERLYNLIYIVDPDLIIACGKTAFNLLTKSNREITKYRGQIFDVEHPGRVRPVQYPVMGIFHPSYLLRKADWALKGGDYDKTVRDIHTALTIVDAKKQKHLGEPMPYRPEPT